MQHSVLVVDDDPATLSGLAALLQSADYRVFTASSYDAARAVLRAEQPHVVLVDIRLGQFNGLQLVMQASQSASIVITGHDDRQLEAEARGLGAEYLVKPVSPAVLLKTIERQISPR